jgi:hypothetical protein
MTCRRPKPIGVVILLTRLIEINASRRRRAERVVR